MKLPGLTKELLGNQDLLDQWVRSDRWKNREPQEHWYAPGFGFVWEGYWCEPEPDFVPRMMSFLWEQLTGPQGEGVKRHQKTGDVAIFIPINMLLAVVTWHQGDDE